MTGSPTDGPDDEPMLMCERVEVAYGSVQILFGVDITVARNEIVALLGTNGAGKSTLLKAVSQLVDPIGGRITLDGQDITHVGAVEAAKAGIVQVPGGKATFPTLTVAEHFTMGRWLHQGADAAELDERTESVLDRFPRIRERWEQQAGNLSGGEQQQLALGMAFVARPKLLIIDELSLGLAPVIVEQLLDMVRTIHADGCTIILVEQSVNVALTVADRAYFMEKGEVRFEGPTADLLQRGDILRSVFLEGAGAGSTGGTTVPAVAARETASEAAVPVLVAEDLRKSFGGIKAVNGAHFRLHQGEILGLIGPNGAGKTTIFDLVSGILDLDHGRLEFLGTDITDWGADRRAGAGLGRSFQDARIFPSMTVAENIAFALERHLPHRDHLAAALALPAMARMEEDIAYTTEDLIELLSLGAFRDKFVGELSTGSRRIIDLAMAIAHDPQRPAARRAVERRRPEGDRGPRSAAPADQGRDRLRAARDRARHAAAHLHLRHHGRPRARGGGHDRYARRGPRRPQSGQRLSRRRRRRHQPERHGMNPRRSPVAQRRLAASVIAALALVAGSLGVAPAHAAPVVDVAWWTSSQIAGVPVGAATIVPPGGLQVATGSSDPVSIGAVRFAAEPGTLNAIRLPVSPGSTVETASIVACPATAAWAPTHGGEFATAPTWDCTLGQVANAYDPASTTVRWDFDASFIRDGVIDVLLLPNQGSLPFSVTTGPPADDAVLTTVPSGPPTSAAPSSTTQPAPPSADSPPATASTGGFTPGRPPIDPAPPPVTPAGLPSPLPTVPEAADDVAAPAMISGTARPESAVPRALAIVLFVALAALAALVWTGRLAVPDTMASAGVRGVGRFARERDDPAPTI